MELLTSRSLFLLGVEAKNTYNITCVCLPVFEPRSAVCETATHNICGLKMQVSILEVSGKCRELALWITGIFWKYAKKLRNAGIGGLQTCGHPNMHLKVKPVY